MIGDNIMLAVAAGNSFEENMELNLYSDENKKEYGYLGLYKDKAIRAVGKVTKVVTVENINGVLQVNGEVTEDEMQRILRDEKEYYNGNSKGSRKIFLVNKFYETNYKNIGTQGIVGCKKFKLSDLFEKIPETTKEIAAQLNGKTFELGKSQPSLWKGVPFETCVELANENGVTWEESSDPKINRMRLIMALKEAKVSPTKKEKEPSQSSPSSIRDGEIPDFDDPDFK